MKKIALIPAYEPDMAMIDVVGRLDGMGYDIVVINDGSAKEYEDVFRQAEISNAMVIDHKQNMGKGTAIKTGLSYISKNYAAPYTVVTVDADGQHRPEDVDKVCGAAEKDRGTLVLGRRGFDGNVPARSRFGNTVTRLVYQICSGNKIYDTQTGLRAFSYDLIPELLSVEGERYEYEMNMLLAFAKKRIPMQEFPIETVYLEKNQSSHFNAVKDSIIIYKEIIKFSGVSFLSFLLDYGLYAILLNITGVLTASNILARVLSATFNYSMNRNVVFKSNESVKRSAIMYAALAVFILAMNTALLAGLSYLGINVYVAKVMTEMVMFVLSYVIQHQVIFRKSEIGGVAA